MTYIGVGVLAFIFLTREFFNPNGIAAQIMWTPDQADLWRHVTIWMLPFQILRGLLIAAVLFPFLSCLQSWPYWKRVLTIGGLYIVLGPWASAVAGSGTIEGWLILGICPLWQHGKKLAKLQIGKPDRSFALTFL